MRTWTWLAPAVLCLAGCNFGYERTDLRLYMAPAAKYWAGEKIAKPSAVYDNTGETAARRTVTWVDAETVLVEDVVLTDVFKLGVAMAMAPFSSTLRLLRVKDGTEVWRRPIEARIGKTDAAVVMTSTAAWWGRRDGKQHVYTPIDLKTGQPGADVTVAAQHRMKLSADGSRVFVVDRADAATTVRAWKSTGEKLWEAPPLAGSSALPAIDISSSAVFVTGEGLAAFDQGSGKALFTTPPAPKGPETLWLVADAPLLSSENSVRLLSATGQPVWQRDLGGPVAIVAAGRSEVYAVVVGAAPAVVALRKAKGDEAWRAPLPGGELPSGDLAVSADALALTTSGHLVVVAAKDGSVDAIDLPPGFSKTPAGKDIPARLPDRVIWDGASVVVAGELGIARFDAKKKLHQSWAFFAEGAIGGSLAWEGLGQVHGPRKRGARAMDAATLAQIRDRLNMSQALGSAAAGVNQMGDAFKGVSGKAAAGVGVGAASVGMALSGQAAGQAIAAEMLATAAETKRELLGLQLEMATRRHTLALQGDYYVRPIQWYGGEGVLVVSWKNGTWKELLTGPDEPLIAPYYVLFPLAVVSPDGKTLFTEGPGVDASRYRVVPGYFHLGNPAHLSQTFDLGAEGFASASTYSEASLTRRPFAKAR